MWAAADGLARLQLQVSWPGGQLPEQQSLPVEHVAPMARQQIFCAGEVEVVWHWAGGEVPDSQQSAASVHLSRFGEQQLFAPGRPGFRRHTLPAALLQQSPVAEHFTSEPEQAQVFEAVHVPPQHSVPAPQASANGEQQVPPTQAAVLAHTCGEGVQDSGDPGGIRHCPEPASFTRPVQQLWPSWGTSPRPTQQAPVPPRSQCFVQHCASAVQVVP